MYWYNIYDTSRKLDQVNMYVKVRLAKISHQYDPKNGKHFQKYLNTYYST